MKAKPPKMDTAAVQSELWQKLPFELVLVILELLARQNPERAHQIVLVSRAVQRCIDPFLYEAVTLRTSEAIVSFAWTICQPDCINKPLSFFQDHVKSVCFMVEVYDDIAVSLIVSRCPQIHTLAFEIGYADLVSCKSLPLRKLSTEWVPWLGILDAPKPLFPFLTHLDLFDVHHWEELDVPECLPLTHLCVSFSGDGDVGLSPSLESKFPPTLKVIIARTVFIDTDCLEGRCQHDIRIVYCFSELPIGAENLDHILVRHADSQNFSTDWGRTPIGELNTWEMAEDVVKKRREALRLKEQA